MSPRVFPLLLLLAVSLPVVAQDDAPDMTGTHPLNLSLPRDALWPSVTRPDSSGAEMHQNRSALPEFEGQIGQGGRLPYGTGYEARQRSSARAESINATGMGGVRGGRGWGRGR